LVFFGFSAYAISAKSYQKQSKKPAECRFFYRMNAPESGAANA
jgi:hypothetical protein